MSTRSGLSRALIETLGVLTLAAMVLIALISWVFAGLTSRLSGWTGGNG